jgi:hypothetical protein
MLCKYITGKGLRGLFLKNILDGIYGINKIYIYYENTKNRRGRIFKKGGLIS